jgi:Arabinose-binding domain of AraC transcription regulator, N-term
VDVTEEKILQALPTVAGIAAKLTLAVLKKQNVAVAPLLRRAGLSEHDFDARQQRISAASQGKFLEYAAEAMDDSAFGLHLAETANPREAGLLFYITSAGSNIDEALALFARYSRIANEAVRVKHAHASEGVVAEISFVGLSRHTAKQVTEFGVGITIKALREIAGRNIRPTHLSFIHAGNSDLPAFEQFFRHCESRCQAHRSRAWRRRACRRPTSFVRTKPDVKWRNDENVRAPHAIRLWLGWANS